jgi:DNA-binding response OmpR family regulator
MKVLLVDDERELVITLSERLGLRGINAAWATSAEEALSWCRRSLLILRSWMSRCQK